MSLAKTDEWIEMLFGWMTRVSPRNHALVGGPDLPVERTIFGEVVQIIEKQ